MPQDYLSYLDSMAKRYGIPPEEARAIYALETNSGRNVRNSSAGAQGHMQLMPATARELGVDPNDPLQNIAGGVRYYSQQRKAFGDPALAAAAYNAGPGRVRRAGGVPNIRETQKYVSRFRKMLGVGTPVTATTPSAIIDQAPQGQPTMDQTDTTGGALPGGTAMRGLMDLAREQQEYAAQREQAFKDRFEQGQKEIEQRYGGPSTSQTLFALSRALLAPRPYRGFAGTMYNVNEALGGISDQARTAEQKRADALAQLRASYEGGVDEAKLGSMEARRKLLEAQLEQETELAKAGRPTVQLSQTGELVEVPKQVYKPVTPTDYDRIPVGAYYMVPSGPSAGKVVRKNAPTNGKAQ